VLGHPKKGQRARTYQVACTLLNTGAGDDRAARSPTRRASLLAVVKFARRAK
jgi:hypothetical protein